MDSYTGEVPVWLGKQDTYVWKMRDQKDMEKQVAWKVSALEEVIFHQTTAIGLRKRKEVRRILPRKKETVMTPYWEVELKICTSAGETYIYPEYDSIRGLVQETGRSYQEIYQKAVEEAWKKRKND